MIKINGKTFTGGRNISVRDDKIFIDGIEQKDVKLRSVLKIELTGDLASLETDLSVTMNGNVYGNVDAGGSVQCKNVGGDVDAGGSVQCGDVEGEVDAGGSVNCGKVNGDVDAGGSITHL